MDLCDGETNPQIVDSIEVIFKIPWGHHRYFIDKCKGNRKKAIFFVMETLKNNWSRAVLMNFLDTNLYERQGKAITNFDKILPDTQSDLAQKMTKDPYNFDFLTLRQEYEFLKLFLDAKEVEGCSERTISYYKSTIEHLMSMIETPVITTEEIREYLAEYQKMNKLFY